MNGKMSQAYKGEYVDYNLDDVNNLIYNDLPIDELFYDDEEDFSKNLNKMLYKNEVAKHIPFLRDEYYATNFGRVLNLRRIKEMTVTQVREDYLAFTANKRRWRLDNLMIENKWTFDMPLIVSFYKDINYPFRKEDC